MLNAASLPAGTSIVPVTFCPRVAVAVPTVNVLRSCAAPLLKEINTSETMAINRCMIINLQSKKLAGPSAVWHSHWPRVEELFRSHHSVLFEDRSVLHHKLNIVERIDVGTCVGPAFDQVAH